MVVVPLYGVNSQEVVLVGFQVLATVRLGAEVDIALFSSNQEQVLVGLIEVEAHAAGKSVEEGLLLVVELLVLVNNELELDNLLSFKLVLHENPVGNATVTRN